MYIIKNKQLIKFTGMLLLLVFSFLNSGANKPSQVSEQEVSARIELLNKMTPINLVYNKDVQSFIDVYTIKQRDHLAKIIGLSELYFPLFEEHLDKMGLPLELKYLAIVESALQPKAKSTSGAMGLWQFLFQASRMMGLQVNSYIDERCDPIKSTEAAAKYLKYLYENFNDWELALAAYNGGIATVNAAIIKSHGKKNFWDIRKHFSAETRGYVPAFIAVNYVMNHYDSYGIVPIKPIFNYDDIQMVELDKSVTFRQLSELLTISVEELRFLNPSYIMDYIPVVVGTVQFFIPKSKVELFYKNLEHLKVESGPKVAKLPPIGDTEGRIKSLHIVAKGEFFHKIAMDYSCRVEDIQKWNNLKTRDLLAGQKLIIWKRIEEYPWFFVCETELSDLY